MKQVSQASQQRLSVVLLVFCLVFQDFVSEGTTEVKSLEDTIAITGVVKVDQTKVMFVSWKIV